MRYLAVGIFATLFAGLATIAAHGTPPTVKPIVAGNPSITTVQGWWEQEHRWPSARDRYWRLPPPALDRYNRLQAEINDLQAQRREIDERLNRALSEQHQILGYRPR